MYEDNKISWFYLRHELSRENLNTAVGTSSITAGLITGQSSGSFDKEDTVTFSNIRRTNFYMRISRKAYEEELVRRHLNFVQVTWKECPKDC